MTLTTEQREKLVAFVKAKWKPPIQCNCCKENNWDIAHEVFQIIQFTPGGIALGGPIVPLAPVTCTNCGNTILINALVADIVEQPKTEEHKEAASHAK
jgi:hypothetical protein